MKLNKFLKTLIAIIGVTTIVIHIMNRIITFTSGSINSLKNTKGDMFEWKFGDIFYTCEGSGPPLLLIHDLETYSSGCEWYKVRKELSKTHTLYTLDLLGCGRSDKPCITYTNYLYVQLITDFIESIIKEKTDIVSSSASSTIAITTPLHNNDLIDKMIFINPCSITSFSKSPNKQTRFFKQFISLPIFGTFFYNMFNTLSKIGDKFASEFYYNTDSITENELKLYYETAHMDESHSKYLFASIKGNYLNANIPHALKSLNNSIYIIASKESPDYISIAEHYQLNMPSIEIFELSNAKKYPQLEVPDELVSQINFFLED